MKILLAGDIHGNIPHAEYIVNTAVDQGAGVILQLGDFGLWPGAGGLRYRDALESALQAANLHMFVTGGNHEDYDQVDRAYAGLKPDDIWWIERSIGWLPRGKRIELDGVRFLSLGGAYSIDKPWRTPHRSWWPQEQITDEDVERAKLGGKVDVMITHDKPKGSKPAWNRKDIFECWPNQERIQEVVEATRPKFLFHGHLHYSYYDKMSVTGGWITAVRGLNCDGEGVLSWEVVDTDDLHSIHQYESKLSVRHLQTV